MIEIIPSIVDIDECSRGTDRCDAIATCMNTIGSYLCACPNGTNGNGFTCTGEERVLCSVTTVSIGIKLRAF